jgi:hypothetical protein
MIVSYMYMVIWNMDVLCCINGPLINDTVTVVI